jgi:hypothetical protein
MTKVAVDLYLSVGEAFNLTADQIQFIANAAKQIHDFDQTRERSGRVNEFSYTVGKSEIEDTESEWHFEVTLRLNEKEAQGHMVLRFPSKGEVMMPLPKGAEKIIH